MASNLLPSGSGRNEELLEERCLGGAVGITEEVLAFARNIAMHPETWLDFPLDEEEDLDGMCVVCDPHLVCGILFVVLYCGL